MPVIQHTTGAGAAAKPGSVDHIGFADSGSAQSVSPYSIGIVLQIGVLGHDDIGSGVRESGAEGSAFAAD